jgi:cell division protein FtsW (lipid II flippase)
MADIFILLSKYLFLIYMGVFLFSGFIINLVREGWSGCSVPFALQNQRISLVAFHINACLILIMTAEEKLPVLYFSLIGLVYIIVGNLVLRKLYSNASELLYNGLFFLADIGLVMLYRLNPDYAVKQLIWNGVGFVIMLALPPILTLMPRLDKFRILYFIFSVLLLGATLIIGSSEYGAKSWIKLGSIAFQPSELVKILFVLYLSSALAQKPRFKQLIVPAICSGVIILFFVAETDMGSALIFVMTFLCVLFIATGNYLYFGGGLGAVALASTIAYKMFSHIRVRVQIWQNPWDDVANSGYQIAQSLFAICTWGVMGIGFTKGYAKSIPVVEKDFIFAAICEEFGVIFAIGLILVFVMIFLEGARAALENHSRFLSLLAAGFTALIAFQSFVIIGGVIKMIPLTGVTLPFISYGGTSIVTSYVIITFIQWITQKNTNYETDRKAEKKSVIHKGRNAVDRRQDTPMRQPGNNLNGSGENYPPVRRRRTGR